MNRTPSGFEYIKEVLHCEGVALPQLGARFGTPLYVYSASVLRQNAERLTRAASGRKVSVFYAVKANSTSAILKRLAAMGWGADVVSEGEMRRAMHAGFAADRIVFSGVGKTKSEIRAAAERGIHALQIESTEEIRQAAEAVGEKSLRVSLRINPDIDAKTHPKIATGLYDTKFGIAEEEISAALTELKKHPQLRLVALASHLGSQISDPGVYTQAARRLSDIRRVDPSFASLEYVDVGGGFFFDYRGTEGTDFDVYLKAISAGLEQGQAFGIEPGRSLVANSGILLTEVLRTKETPKKKFAIVDAAMTELIRPTLYEAFHPIQAVRETAGAAQHTYDVVGPVCETSDYLGLNRDLPELHAGDLVAIRHTGAYGSTMASTYNSRPRAAEVLVDGMEIHLITERETHEQLSEREA